MPPYNPNLTGIGFFFNVADPDPHVLGHPDPDSLVRGMDTDPDPALDPDPLVRGMDPRMRIRIHPKMSWIRNTGYFYRQYLKLLFIGYGFVEFLTTTMFLHLDDDLW
jgi:hypothetical protein